MCLIRTLPPALSDEALMFICPSFDIRILSVAVVPPTAQSLRALLKSQLAEQAAKRKAAEAKEKITAAKVKQVREAEAAQMLRVTLEKAAPDPSESKHQH